jgi:hypothetical protein
MSYSSALHLVSLYRNSNHTSMSISRVQYRVLYCTNNVSTKPDTRDILNMSTAMPLILGVH